MALMERDRAERCYFCKADCSQRSETGSWLHFCHGCGEFVCERCDLDGDNLIGHAHDVEEHRASA